MKVLVCFWVIFIFLGVSSVGSFLSLVLSNDFGGSFIPGMQAWVTDTDSQGGVNCVHEAHTRGTPPKWNSIKNCVFILTCCNFSHLQSTVRLMQYTYRDFFPLLKTVFELVDFDVFSASAVFRFTSSTLATVSL